MKNVVEVLKGLSEGENYFIQIPDYKRIGNKVVDEFEVFVRKSIPTPTPFELVGNENRLNISIQNKIYGVVTLNPIQAKKVGLPKTISGPIEYKTKTVIRDGKLNAEKIEIIVDMVTFMKIKKAGLKFQQLEELSYPGIHMILDLTGLPIADNCKVNTSLEEVLSNMNEINILKAKQKVLNALVNKLPSTKDEPFAGFTAEQTEMLREHGLNEKLQYIGVDVKVEETEEAYTGQVIEFKLKGSSMSSFSEMLNRVASGKKLNALDQVQFDFNNEVTDMVAALEITEAEDLRTFYKSELKKIKGKLFTIKLQNVIIKMIYSTSSLQEVALDSTGDTQYKGMLTVSFKDAAFTK